MDEKELFEKFMGVNSLAVEGVSRTVGMVIAKLRQGMMEGGMGALEVDLLLNSLLQTFITSIMQQSFQRRDAQ